MEQKELIGATSTYSIAFTAFVSQANVPWIFMTEPFWQIIPSCIAWNMGKMLASTEPKGPQIWVMWKEYYLWDGRFCYAYKKPWATCSYYKNPRLSFYRWSILQSERESGTYCHRRFNFSNSKGIKFDLMPLLISKCVPEEYVHKFKVKK